MEAVDRVEEEQGPDAVVEVGAVAAEPVEGVALGEQLGVAQPVARRRQRAVAHGRLGGEDDVGEHRSLEEESRIHHRDTEDTEKDKDREGREES